MTAYSLATYGYRTRLVGEASRAALQDPGSGFSDNDCEIKIKKCKKLAKRSKKCGKKCKKDKKQLKPKCQKTCGELGFPV